MKCSIASLACAANFHLHKKIRVDKGEPKHMCLDSLLGLVFFLDIVVFSKGKICFFFICYMIDVTVNS